MPVRDYKVDPEVQARVEGLPEAEIAWLAALIDGEGSERTPMSVIINPGSGPVANATRENAEENISRFIKDLALPGDVTVKFVKECRSEKLVGTWPHDVKWIDDGPDGRFEFELTHGEHSLSVEMPGLPLDQVRYVDAASQNIWDFPRLYVDGGSWIWKFGVGVATRTLSGEDDDDE